MTQITNGTIVFDADELTWWTENYGTTEWAVYVAGMDEIVTHDRQNSGDDPDGEPFTEASAREYLAEMDSRFGPGSPMDLELPGDPLYAVALHCGVPAFESHEHRYPVLPPDGAFDKPGDCACGALYADAVKAWDKKLAATEWAVWVAGLGVLTRQDVELDDDDPANPPFTEESARRYATWVKTEMAPIRRDEANSATVLHYGVPETQATLAEGTDTRTPGLITPDNAPRLADLDDDTTPYPSQITITCDGCPAVDIDNYLVPAESTKAERFEIARIHLRTVGWSCTADGDFCPGCSSVPVLAEVQAERMRQIAKWGVQRREDGTGDPVMRNTAEDMRNRCNYLAEHGGADWRAVLLEEVYEALAEEDPAKLRAELVQVAAVCVAWVEDIDSRTAGA